jgi:peptidoglycan hydrolase-like protein with peptidoglycan-binding domain
LKVTRKEILKAIQAILKATGYYKGTIDGLMGPKTRAALEGAGIE